MTSKQKTDLWTAVYVQAMVQAQGRNPDKPEDLADEAVTLAEERFPTEPEPEVVHSSECRYVAPGDPGPAGKPQAGMSYRCPGCKGTRVVLS